MESIRIGEKILAKNAEMAARNRERFEACGICVVMLAGSPGSGKTSLLEQSVPVLGAHFRVGVIEGDIETDRDGQRIAKLGVPVVQIVTGGTCHLNAAMVNQVLDRLPLDCLDLLLVENVGNLVCPAAYDLGEHLYVVVGSVTEGEDKPVKYPAMFRRAHAMVLNKMDLLPHLNFSVQEAIGYAQLANPLLRIFPASCRTGEGIAAWMEWLIWWSQHKRVVELEAVEI